MRLKPEEISRVIREQIKNYEAKVSEADTGTVLIVGDGIARVSGLDRCVAGELLHFATGGYGMAMNLEENSVAVALLGEDRDVAEGTRVERTGRVVSVPAGEKLIGRVLNALGEPIDGKGPVDAAEMRPVEHDAPGIIERKSVSVPLQTGIKAIDSMIPIGRGQRELIIGDRQTGKTAIATDTIINQKGKNVICVYVAIGQKQSTVAQLVEQLTRAGAMDYTIVVSATASESAPMQYIGEMPEIVRTEDGATLAVELQFDTSLDAALAEAGLTRGVYLAALTDTLMGFIPGIDGLRVRIGGEAVEALDAQQTPRGEALLFAEGMMTRADFAGYAGAPCTLYLPAEGGICEVSCVVDQQRANSPRERLGQLMRMGALPRGLTDADVLAVAVEPERVLVNLSGAFAEALSGLSAQEERAAVYAMVNTLTEFAGTDGTPQRIAFFFDGVQRESLAGGIEMRGELMRNPGMVVD